MNSHYCNGKWLRLILTFLLLICNQIESLRKIRNDHGKNLRMTHGKIPINHKRHKNGHHPIKKSQFDNVNEEFNLPFKNNNYKNSVNYNVSNKKINKYYTKEEDIINFEPVLNHSLPIHRNYDEMVWLLLHYNRTCKNLIHIYTVGLSTQNRQLWVAALASVSPDKHIPGRPEIKLIANIHGNEPSGRYLLLRLIGQLCQSYFNGNTFLRKLLSRVRLHILPSLNPDGFEFAFYRRTNDSLIGRLNSNGIDLNRNYPDQFFPAKIVPEMETVAVMEWMHRIPFVLSASFHDGAFVVSYPFDDSPSGQSKYSATPDDDIFRHLARSYAEKHPVMHLSKMNDSENCSSSSKRFMNGITNGAEWSSLTNTMQDYNYLYSGCMEITVSLGCNRITETNRLDKIFQENYEAILNFVAKALISVHGFVFDEEKKPLLNCTISVNDRRHDVLTSTDGDYWRILLPGTYEITAKLSGYTKSTLYVSFEPTKPDSIQLNFTLSKVSTDKSTLLLGHVTHETELLNENIFKNDGRDSVEVLIENDTIKNHDSTKNNGRENNENEVDEEAVGTNNRFVDKLEGENQILNFTTISFTNDDSIESTDEKDTKTPVWELDEDLICYLPTKLKKIEGKLKWQDIVEFPGSSGTADSQPISVVGIELYTPDPKATDGTLWGKRYFQSLPNRAYFVASTNCRHMAKGDQQF